MARQKIAKSHGWWTVIISLSWMSLAILFLWPASFWFDVRNVHVFDAVQGEEPLMQIDRVIKRNFRAAWTVTVLREQKDGSFTTYTPCTTGLTHNDYRVGNALPDRLGLDWWTWDDDTFPVVCRPPPGRYKVNTVWVVTPDLLPRKTIRSQSNVFKVIKGPPF